MQKKIMPERLTGGWIGEGEGLNYLVELYRQEEVNSSLTQSASVAAVRGMKMLKPGRWTHGMMRCGSCVRFS